MCLPACVRACVRAPAERASELISSGAPPNELCASTGSICVRRRRLSLICVQLPFFNCYRARRTQPAGERAKDHIMFVRARLAAQMHHCSALGPAPSSALPLEKSSVGLVASWLAGWLTYWPTGRPAGRLADSHAQMDEEKWRRLHMAH